MTTAVKMPAQIRRSAAAELRELATDPRSIRDLVLTLLRVVRDPAGAGVPLGPCEAAFRTRIGEGTQFVIYTVDEHQGVTVEGFRKVVAL